MRNEVTREVEKWRKDGWAWTVESILPDIAAADPMSCNWSVIVGKDFTAEDGEDDYEECEIRHEDLYEALEETFKAIRAFERSGEFPVMMVE